MQHGDTVVVVGSFAETDGAEEIADLAFRIFERNVILEPDAAKPFMLLRERQSQLVDFPARDLFAIALLRHNQNPRRRLWFNPIVAFVKQLKVFSGKHAFFGGRGCN